MNNAEENHKPLFNFLKFYQYIFLIINLLYTIIFPFYLLKLSKNTIGSLLFDVLI